MLKALGGGDKTVGRDRVLNILDSANCNGALAMLTDPVRSKAVANLLGDGDMLEAMGGGDKTVGRERVLRILDSANGSEYNSAIAMLTDPTRSGAVVRLLNDYGMLATLGGGDTTVGRGHVLHAISNPVSSAIAWFTDHSKTEALIHCLQNAAALTAVGAGNHARGQRMAQLAFSGKLAPTFFTMLGDHRQYTQVAAGLALVCACRELDVDAVCTAMTTKRPLLNSLLASRRNGVANFKPHGGVSNKHYTNSFISQPEMWFQGDCRGVVCAGFGKARGPKRRKVGAKGKYVVQVGRHRSDRPREEEFVTFCRCHNRLPSSDRSNKWENNLRCWAQKYKNKAEENRKQTVVIDIALLWNWFKNKGTGNRFSTIAADIETHYDNNCPCPECQSVQDSGSDSSERDDDAMMVHSTFLTFSVPLTLLIQQHPYFHQSPFSTISIPRCSS